MANHVGNEGTVKFATNAIGELRGFEITERVDTVDDTVMGDTWKTHKQTHKSWSATMNVLWDETDTNGQAACTVGASGTFAFLPEGGDSGDGSLSGTGTVKSRAITSSHDGIVTMAIEVEGNGALAVGTV